MERKRRAYEWNFGSKKSILTKGFVVGGKFQVAAAEWEDRQRREKSKRAFKRLSKDRDSDNGGL